MNRPITIVSGLPRSGTSMMMRMLESGGLEILSDGVRRADEDNPLGYYELERAKGLRRGDVDWLREAGGKAVKIVSPLLRFLPEEHRYQIILMRRNMEEILASQRMMLKRRGEPAGADDAKLAAIFEEDLRSIERWAQIRSNVDLLFVSYNCLLANPEMELPGIGRFLGAELDLRAMAAVIEPVLYRQRFVGP